MPQVMQPRMTAAIYGEWRVGKETSDLINFSVFTRGQEGKAANMGT
jgi:hypothetical protein